MGISWLELKKNWIKNKTPDFLDNVFSINFLIILKLFNLKINKKYFFVKQYSFLVKKIYFYSKKNKIKLFNKTKILIKPIFL